MKSDSTLVTDPNKLAMLNGARPQFLARRDLLHFAVAKFRGTFEGFRPLDTPGTRAVEFTMRFDKKDTMSESGRLSIKLGLPDCDSLITILAIRRAEVIVRCSKKGDTLDIPTAFLYPPANWVVNYMLNLSLWKRGAFTGKAAQQYAGLCKEIIEEEKLDATHKEAWQW